VTIRFPELPARSLGIGLDLPWGAPTGWATDANGDDAPSDALSRFAKTTLPTLSHAFISWQPRSRGALNLADYTLAWDALLTNLPPSLTLALHHTALNLAHSKRYDRRALLAFTNTLIERYGFAWVNEDLGFWSLNGKPLPYPLPPLLTDDGLAVAVDNIRECQEALIVPLLVEFPGFSRDWSLVIGPWDAYDFFREAVVRSNSPCTLDTGHLLSWRWGQGHRGQALFDDLERLPLESCFEIHLSGAETDGERFLDAHHGVLMEEQLTLLGLLLERCPQVRAVTFEDPVLTETGSMNAVSATSWQSLQPAVVGWRS
jgi:uncharacterized protein (UPF0276 family)